MSQFDTVIDRRGTGSLKWDAACGALPFWVADMDFKSPECIVDAMRERVENGVFGYAVEPAGFRRILVDYMRTRHNTEISEEWIVHIVGCVPALSVAVTSFCGEGDSVMTCSPVYPPIRCVHEAAGATLIEVSHIRTNNRWEFDWEAMEKAVRPDTKMFILCNPQNPLGRVFTREELLRLADFCERHGLLLCSDEIHCDLILDEEAVHVPAVSLPEKYHDRIISMTAPSKTYNIAGVGYSMVMIPSAKLRSRFQKIQDLGQPSIHCLAYASAQAAYSLGDQWRRELVAYLAGNRDALYQFVEKYMPGIKIYPMQATYLAWLDCSALGLENPQQFFLEKAGIYLNPGTPFGDPHCVRFNFGTTRKLMLEGLQKMADALSPVVKCSANSEAPTTF